MIRGFFRTGTSLKTIEKSVERLFSLTPDAVLLINSAGLVETINKECHELLGYEANEVRGVLAETLFPDIYSTPALGRRTDYLESREAHEMGGGLDVRGKRKDGSFVWVELAATPMDIGKQGYVLLFARDLTARKRAEEKLARAENRFRTIVETAPDAMIISRRSGEISMVNRAAETLLDYNRSELIGMQIDDLVPEASRTEHKELSARFFKAPAVRIIEPERTLYVCPREGPRIPVDISLSPINIQNENLVVASLRDISTQVEALQTAREKDAMAKSIVKYAPDAIALVEWPGGRIVEANQAAADLFGYPLDELIGMTTDQIRPEYQPGGVLSTDFAEKQNKAALAGEQPVFEWTGLNSRGEEVRCENRMLLLPGHEGKFIRVSSIDISDRIEKEAAIKEAYELKIRKEAAEKLSQDQSEFLARMSHEIRTPMNGVVGLLELLAYSPLDRDQQEMLSATRGSAEMTLQILNDILDFSKIEAGKLTFEKISFDIREVAEFVGEVLGVAASEKGLDLQVNIDPQVPTELTGDPLRLRQILFNLLGNAVKFTQHGSVMLNITRVEGKEPNSISYEITDSGIGIGEKDLAGLFTPFSQAQASTTRRFGGTGLGLTIVKNLVEQMGGQIEVKSVPGKGSTFSFVLEHDDFSFEESTRKSCTSGQAGDVFSDATGQNERKHPATDMAVAVSGIEDARSQNRLILLAEDYSTNQMVIGRQLSLLGYAHELAENGAIALSMLRKGQYGLLLTDIAMPEMDGYELARSVRQDEEEQGVATALPIIAVSAVTRSGQVTKDRSSGINEYLTKPMKLKELQDALYRWMPPLTDDNDTDLVDGAQTSALKLPASPHFRPGAIGEFFACEAQDYNEILLDFQQSASACIAAMNTDFVAGDLQKVADGGHKLKSAARSVGADRLADICQMLENVTTGGNLAEPGALVIALKQEFTALQFRLKNDLAVK